MLVSIIITSYNYGTFLAEAIDSALNQDHPQVEVIVVDDGSTDGSAGIIESYGNRITAIIKDNGGQCSCFNVGFARSRGGGVIFLDADDVLLPRAASVHAARLGSGAVKSCGYMDVIDPSGRPTGARIPRQLPESGDYLQETLEHGLDAYQTSFTSGHAWSRKFLEQVLPIPENDIIGADGYLTAIDRLFGRLEFVHESVASYRLHADNKGPASFRFDARHLEHRVQRKQHRIRYAAEWLERLGHQGDRHGLEQIRDWRVILMMHALCLMEAGHTPVRLWDLVSSPFRTRPLRVRASGTVAACLLIIRVLPRRAALALARRILERTQVGRVGERRVRGATAWRRVDAPV